jgi:ankyrin repeat protein
MFFKKTDDGNSSRKPKKIIEPNYVDDEPEVDYDEGVTLLYKEIEEKNWEKVIARLDTHPHEARAWIFRRESSNARKIRWRLLPLHASCIFRSPLAVIEALVAAYPDGAQMKDDQDMLPLHLACRNGASKGVVLTLLYAFPEALGIRDRKGRTPFDLVEASNSQNRELVLSALKKYQKEAENESNANNRTSLDMMMVGNASSVAVSKANEVDYEHRTILFRLVLKKEWVNAAKRAEAVSEEAGTWISTKGFHGNLRFLPLHKACVLQPPVSFIQALIDAYPEGAKSKDQDGWLPIHCACFYGAGQEIVDCLLMANPNGAHAKDDEGRMALHYASLKGATEGVVSALLRANPKAAVSKDDEGRLPIHHACSKGAPDGVIEALLKVSPKGAQSKDDQGRLPMHHACRKKATERVVKTLLTIYPRGAQVKDDQEKLPIHYGCQNGAGEDIINLLLASYPESVDAKNG